MRSVLAQDHPDLEYIVVDGDSHDGSVEVIRRYQHRLAWWVSEPDRGQADAIAKGFKHASGEFIAWLNSDDLYLPGAVSHAVSLLQADPQLGMVYGDAVTIDEQGRPLKRLAFGDWGLLELMSFRIICQPAVFMRRSVFERAGGLDPSYHFMLDHHLWVRMASIMPIQHAGHIWAAARHHPHAKNVSQSASFADETQRILSWMRIQPELQPVFAAHRKKISGGANRLCGRYLLDGDQPAAALRAYRQALVEDPGYAIRHWHRMLFAIISMLGGKKLADSYYRLKRGQRTDRSIFPISPALESWPGLRLSDR